MSEEVQTPEPVATPTPQPEPTPKPRMISDEGTFTQEFRDSLPDDLGKHSSFDKYKSATDYFKGAINAQGLATSKAEDFWKSEDPDHVAKRNEIMGKVQSVAEYEYDAIDMPEGISQENLNSRIEVAKEKFKEIGLNKEQAKALIELDLSAVASDFAAQEEAVLAEKTAADNALRDKWKGEAYDSNLNGVVNTLNHLNAPESLIEKYGNDPEFIEWVHNDVRSLVSDDTIIEARQVQNEQTLNDSYDAQFAKMQSMDPNSAAYAAEIRKMTEITSKMQ